MDVHVIGITPPPMLGSLKLNIVLVLLEHVTDLTFPIFVSKVSESRLSLQFHIDLLFRVHVVGQRIIDLSRNGQYKDVYMRTIAIQQCLEKKFLTEIIRYNIFAKKVLFGIFLSKTPVSKVIKVSENTFKVFPVAWIYGKNLSERSDVVHHRNC